MKLIIEISEKIYDTIMADEMPTREEMSAIITRIYQGTPLQQGHGRLIEVSKELECELWTYTRYTGIDEAPYEDATNALELAPTIIEADAERR